MAQVKVYYEPAMELLTVFWQAPRPNQICTELGDGVILMKDATTGQPIGLEFSNSHYSPVVPRRVRAPGLHPPQNRHLVGRVPSPGAPSPP